MVGWRIEFVGGDVAVPLESWAGGEIPELTRRVARRAFPKGSLAILLRDSLGHLFDDALFAAAFPADGRPAASPGTLAMVSVMQYAERQAAEAVRARIDWKKNASWRRCWRPLPARDCCAGAGASAPTPPGWSPTCAC
ncbi:hypothetical protein ACWF95_37940 [Streptomyces vinaceus]